MSPLPVVTPMEQGGLTTQDPITIALIMDCPTINSPCSENVIRALIDSGAAVSLIRYSTYQLIDDSFKTPIQWQLQLH